MYATQYLNINTTYNTVDFGEYSNTIFNNIKDSVTMLLQHYLLQKGQNEQDSFKKEILNVYEQDIYNSIILENYNTKLKEDISKQLQTADIYTKDWDGYDADPVRKDSVKMMRNYLDNLIDTNIPFPSITAEPSGLIALDWYGNNGSFVLAFNDIDKRMEYSFIKRKPEQNGFGEIKDAKDINNYIMQIL